MFLVIEKTSSEVSAARLRAIRRCFAKGADFSLVFFVSLVVYYPFGVLLGFAYTLLHDGIKDGQSLAKMLLHLKVVNVNTGKPCSLRESVIRNIPLGMAVLFASIPIWGWILLILLGIPLVALEIYLMFSQKAGGRLGDVMADTQVVELPKIR